MNKTTTLFTLLSVILLCLILTGCSSEYSSTSAYSPAELEEAREEISKLKDCNDEMQAALDAINSDAAFYAWSDYDSMGDALDEIESKSSSYNFCN